MNLKHLPIKLNLVSLMYRPSDDTFHKFETSLIHITDNVLNTIEFVNLFKKLNMIYNRNGMHVVDILYIFNVTNSTLVYKEGNVDFDLFIKE